MPLFADTCAAGFPSPVEDYVESELDLNELCIRRRASTFFVRASGSSMQELGLYDGDVMVVDRAEEAAHGDIVIAEVNGKFTVKCLQLHPHLALLPMNPAYSTVYPKELDPDPEYVPGIIRNNRLQVGCLFWQPTDFSANSDWVIQPSTEWGRLLL